MTEYEQAVLEQWETLNATLRDVNFNLGALTSHTNMLLRLRARELQIPVRLHDPSVDGWPTKGNAGDVVEVTEILIGIPYERRAMRVPK